MNRLTLKVCLVLFIGMPIANRFPLQVRPLLYGVVIFVLGMVIWPEARRQPPTPVVERYLVHDGKLVFSRYLYFWMGFSILLSSFIGLLMVP